MALQAACSHQLTCSWGYREDQAAVLVCLPLWRWHPSHLLHPQEEKKINGWLPASQCFPYQCGLDQAGRVSILLRLEGPTLSCQCPLTLASTSFPFLFSASCASLLNSCLRLLPLGPGRAKLITQNTCFNITTEKFENVVKGIPLKRGTKFRWLRNVTPIHKIDKQQGCTV